VLRPYRDRREKHKTSPNGTKREYSYYRCSAYSAEGHPKHHLTEAEIDDQLLALFASIRVEDAESRQWFVDVIRARAHAGQAENKQHRDEVKRQHEQVESKLSTLLGMRMEGEITPRICFQACGLHDRQAGLRVQLEATTAMTVKLPNWPSKRLNFRNPLRSGGLTLTTTQNARF
jgi:hypothetical protein